MPELTDIPNVFFYNGHDLEVTDQMKRAFDTDGFIVVKNLMSKQELDIVEESVTGPGSLTEYAYGNAHGKGREAKMCLWNNAGNDTTGNLARTKKLAFTATKLMGGEVYHYHSKLMMKDAGSGGSFVWHQDYGYWYNFGCLMPDMMTAFIAIDRCGRDNGCLQVLRGSHLCGRIEHIPVGGQVGADPTRVAELEKQLDKFYVELSPGDTLFFHCNLLHTSNRNDSQYRRWAILSCYNRATNNPTGTFHANYNPLGMMENDAVTSLGVSRDLKAKDILIKKDGKYALLEL